MPGIEIDSSATATQLLHRSGVFTGSFEIASRRFLNFQNTAQIPDLLDAPYLVARRPIDIHCHGVGDFDFTEIADLDLNTIERNLEKQATDAVLTLYLPQPSFNEFLALMNDFQIAKKRGELKHILGFALEGPVLASHGGTPGEGVWMPTRREWQELASCGRQGLLYVVLSPDATWAAGDGFSPDDLPPNIEWICDALLDGGVLPAPGHFKKTDPFQSAQALNSLFARVARMGRTTLSDHLFNDMPRLFKHAWRTEAERASRERDLSEIDLPSWKLSNLEATLGPVPAALIRGALDGVVKPCLNFDGEHVDLAISSKAVELLGAENLIAMTDRIDGRRLAGRDLHMPASSTLLYQDQGIVAAGTQTFERQRDNMLSVGITQKEIWQMFAFNPARVLGLSERLGQGLPFSGRFISLTSAEANA